MNRTTPLRRAVMAGAAALSALLLAAGCGNGDMGGMDHGGSGSPSATALRSASSSNGFNGADAMFAQMMIPHHEQAVAMADLAATRAGDPELKELSAKIKAAQAREISTMTG